MRFKTFSNSLCVRESLRCCEQWRKRVSQKRKLMKTRDGAKYFQSARKFPVLNLAHRSSTRLSWFNSNREIVWSRKAENCCCRRWKIFGIFLRYDIFHFFFFVESRVYSSKAEKTLEQTINFPPTASRFISILLRHKKARKATTWSKQRKNMKRDNIWSRNQFDHLFFNPSSNLIQCELSQQSIASHDMYAYRA